MSKRPARLAMLLLALTVIALSAHPASAAGGPPGPIQTADRTSNRSVSDRWIVRLNDLPLAQQIQRALPGAQLQRRYQIVFNGLSVALPGVAASAAIERLQAMPGVAAVYPEQRY